jgi:hypothetical protein
MRRAGQVSSRFWHRLVSAFHPRPIADTPRIGPNLGGVLRYAADFPLERIIRMTAAAINNRASPTAKPRQKSACCTEALPPKSRSDDAAMIAPDAANTAPRRR